jgi:hypothetical protein
LGDTCQIDSGIIVSPRIQYSSPCGKQVLHSQISVEVGNRLIYRHLKILEHEVLIFHLCLSFTARKGGSSQSDFTQTVWKMATESSGIALNENLLKLAGRSL